MLISDVVRRAGRLHGDAPAIATADRTLRFAEFDAATDRLANSLLATDLRAGDRVAVLLPNGIEFLVATHALARAGLVQVPLNTREAPAEHAHRLADSSSRAFIGDVTGVSGPELLFDEDDLARITADGSPLPCDVAVDEEAPISRTPAGRPDPPRRSSPPPPEGGRARAPAARADGGPAPRRPDAARGADHPRERQLLPARPDARRLQHPARPVPPGQFLEELERTRAACTFLVPTMLAMLVDDPAIADVDARSLRSLYWAASPLPESVARRATDALGRSSGARTARLRPRWP